MAEKQLLVLLVEDDHQKFLVTRDQIDDIDDMPYALVWKDDFDSGMEALRQGKFSACLLDLRLGQHSGMEFLKAAQAWGNRVPIILFTNNPDRALEREAIAAGAADFLVKSATNPDSLRRTLRFAMERTRALATQSERDLTFKAIFDNAMDAMLISDSDGKIVDANTAAEVLCGRRRAGLLGKTASELTVSHADTAQIEQGWRQFLKDGHTRGEFAILRPGGELRRAEYHSTANFLPGLQLAVLRDVTEQDRMRNRVAISDRMASAGTLAAGLAHEINNPLAALMGYLDMAAEAVSGFPAGPKKTELDGHLEFAQEAAGRIALTVKDLKRFSRPEEERNSAVDVVAVMESSLRMAMNEIRHRARVVKDLSVLPAIMANESRLGQVFLNLLVNAAQSIAPGHSDKNEITLSSFIEGDRIGVSVSDTGSGMSAAEIARIFDAFYSSKAEHGGTGLGLAICKGLIEEMKGEIRVTSEPGKGSCFTVLLPNTQSAALQAPAPAEGSGKTRGRIMVIDDEPALLNVLEAALKRDHDALPVKSPREALKRLAGGEAVDVILCDMMMPEMTGMEFFRNLEKIDPKLARKVVFSSGGAFTPAEHEFMDSAAHGCLTKPFSRERLLEKVRSIVGP